MPLQLPNLLFFCTIGFVADWFNFAAVQAEIFAANSVLKASSAQLGVLGTLTSLGYVIPTLLTGMLSERTGRRPLLIFSLALLALSYWLGARVTSMNQLYAVSMLRSLATAFLWPPVMAWMARVVPVHQFPHFLGYYNVSWAAGMLTGFYGAGLIFEKYGWQAPFIFCFYTALALLVFAIFAVPAGGRGMAPPADALAAHAPSHGLSEPQRLFFMRQGLLVTTMGTLVVSLLLYIFPKYVEGVMTEREISAMNSLRTVGQMAAFMLFSRIASWHFRSWPVWLCAALLCIGTVIVAYSTGTVTAAAGFILCGIGYGLSFMMCSFYTLGLARAKGTGSGLMETSIGAGGLAGPFIGGMVAQQYSARAGILSSLVSVALVTVAAAWKPLRARK